MYKGPEEEGTTQRRMKFEYSLDSGTEFILSRLYDSGGFRIEKTRETYQIGSFVVILDDDVTRVDSGGKHLIGDFATIWLPRRLLALQPEVGLHSVLNYEPDRSLEFLLSQLGLDQIAPEGRNYSKMPVQ